MSVTITGNDLNIETLVRVARHGEKVKLSKQSISKIEKCRTLVENKIDAGEIIHQTPAVLERGDGLHMLASKSLKKGYDSIITLIKLVFG